MATEILKTNELPANPASPDVLVNAILRQIEQRLVRVKSRTNSGPPGSPAAGDTYIVDSATGAWSSASVGDLAAYYDSAWSFVTPIEGWRVWVNDEDVNVVYDSADWVETPSAGSRTTMATHNMASDADYTLTKAQYSKTVVKITDTTSPPTLTIGRNIIVPAEVRQITFINSTAQTLTLKTSGGTGIAVATAKTAILLCDGTNVVRVTADA